MTNNLVVMRCVNIALLFFCALLVAQNMWAQPGRPEGGMPPIGKITGSVLDSITNQAVEFATISLFRGDKLVGGSISNEQGEFVLTELTPGDYRLQIGFIGYRDRQITLSLNPQIGLQRNVGTIQLASSSVLLNEAEIIATKAVMASNIDKKVFYADQLLSSQAGTVSDILNNVPSVTTDTDGKPSLRGNENVMVLIDGKPSGLAGTNLSQLPASSIQAIEVITNPSAKYDPDGTAGIINIILKKNTKLGFSGQTTVGGGVGLINDIQQGNGNVQLNYGGDKISVSSNMGLRYENRPAYSRNYREVSLPDNPNGDEITYYQQNGTSEDQNLSGSARLGLDYMPNEKNTFSVAANYTKAQRDNTSETNYQTLDAAKNLTQLSIRNNIEDKPSQTIDLNANYRREFGKPQNYLSFDLLHSDARNKGQTNSTQQRYNTDYTPQNTPPALQLDLLDNRLTTDIAQLDYAQPLGKGSLFEAGARAQFRKSDSEFNSQFFDNNASAYYNDSTRINHFVYDENIYAAYATIASKPNKFGYKLGLRAEQVIASGEEMISKDQFDNNYFSLFPSANLSYELTDKQQIQLSYSRRINRPQPSQLNPFTDLSDPLNLRLGNPNLQPEYINSFDLGYATKLANDRYNITAAIYYRRTDNAIVRTLSVSNGINPATGDSSAILRVQFNNAGYSNNYGLEFVLNAAPTNAFNFNINANVFRNELNVTGLEIGQSNSLWMANFKLIATYKLPAGIDLQLSSNINTPRNTPQGRVLPMGQTELSVRKKVLKGAGTLTLNVADIFDTMRFKVTAEDDSLVQEVVRKRQSRFANLSFTYRFGKTDKKKRSERPEMPRNDMPDMGF